MRFRDKRELTAYLRSYETYYWDAIDILSHCLPDSPVISDEPKVLSHISKSETLNKDILRYDYCVDCMNEIIKTIEELKPVNYEYYVLIYDKYVSVMKLESISKKIHRSISYTQKKYNKALNALFNISNDLV